MTKKNYLKVLMLLSASVIVGGVSFAEDKVAKRTGPSSNVAWTIETLKIVRSGDFTRGEKLNQSLECASCHGDDGISTNDTWPSLSGQPAGYTFKILKDYKDKKLSHTHRGELMAYIVEEMSDQDMADLGKFYADNKLPPARVVSKNDIAETLDILGDPTRLIPPCNVCHGKDGQGSFPDFPAMAGQSPEFLARAMRDFRSGKRGNDVYSRMRLIAVQLDDKEIESLADYFSGLGTPLAKK